MKYIYVCLLLNNSTISNAWARTHMKVERNNVPANSGFTVTAITQYQITFVLFRFVSALEHFVSAIISNLSRSWNNGWNLTPKCYHVKPCLLKAKLKSISGTHTNFTWFLRFLGFSHAPSIESHGQYTLSRLAEIIPPTFPLSKYSILRIILGRGERLFGKTTIIFGDPTVFSVTLHNA